MCLQKAHMVVVLNTVPDSVFSPLWHKTCKHAIGHFMAAASKVSGDERQACLERAKAAEDCEFFYEVGSSPAC